MKRYDEGMALLLKYENVAWYEDGKVRILDRRVYPAVQRFEWCSEYGQVAQAIADMVTQSAGPYTAAGMGMALAGYQCRDMKEKKQREFLKQAAYDISHARPTTVKRMKAVTEGCLDSAYMAMDMGEDPCEAMFQRTFDSLQRRYKIMGVVGENLADLIPDGGTVLTQCFGETIIGTALRACRRRGNNIKVVCAETRPYLQGARLTASCAQDMEFDTTVVADNMTGFAMEKMNIDLFTSAADTIAADGYIANKIGTKQMAILAKYYGIPYFVTGIPDGQNVKGKDIVIEMRDPEETLHAGGKKHTLEGVKGVYPAFDITPPELISGLVTDRGTFTPYSLSDYFRKGETLFY